MCSTELTLKTVVIFAVCIAGGMWWFFKWQAKLDKQDAIEDAYCRYTPYTQWKPISTNWYFNKIISILLPMTTAVLLAFLLNNIF